MRLVSFVFLLVLFFLAGCRSEKQETIPELFCVKILKQEAELMDKECVAYAKIYPNRSVSLKSEVEGRVLDVYAARGAYLKAGEPVLQIDPKDKKILLKKAESLVAQKQMEALASEKLLEKGYEAKSKYQETLAALQEALAQKQKAAQDLENTKICAPFDGFLNTRDLEVGDYVQVGSLLGVLIDNNPLLAVLNLSAKQVKDLKVGMPALVELSDTVLGGHLSYISRDSDANIRTYKVEVQFENANYSLSAGLSATVRIPISRMKVHKVSPSVLSLDDEGNLCVKLVNEEDQVVYYPANIEKSSQEFIHLSGLPDTVSIIIQGQGFVVNGQKVLTQE